MQVATEGLPRENSASVDDAGTEILGDSPPGGSPAAVDLHHLHLALRTVEGSWHGSARRSAHNLNLNLPEDSSTTAVEEARTGSGMLSRNVSGRSPNSMSPSPSMLGIGLGREAPRSLVCSSVNGHSFDSSIGENDWW